MGPKKRKGDEHVAAEELLEIREKKRRLSKWMERGAERKKYQKHNAQKTNQGKLLQLKQQKLNNQVKTNHMYMYTLFI